MTKRRYGRYVSSHQDGGVVLTRRGVEVLELLAIGKRAQEISGVLGIAVDTVYEHAAGMRKRLGARDTHELIRLGIHHGFIDAGRASSIAGAIS